MTELEKNEYYYAYLDGRHSALKITNLKTLEEIANYCYLSWMTVEHIYFMKGAYECMHGKPLKSKEELFQ